MSRKKVTQTGGSETTARKGVNRRTMLKGAAAAAGVAIGSKAITGFPTIWAQEIKDITLTHVGMSYSTIIDIAKQASKDLGFKIEMAVTDHPGFVTRVTTQPESVDVADGEIRFPAGLPEPLQIGQGVDHEQGGLRELGPIQVAAPIRTAQREQGITEDVVCRPDQVRERLGHLLGQHSPFLGALSGKGERHLGHVHLQLHGGAAV